MHNTKEYKEIRKHLLQSFKLLKQQILLPAYHLCLCSPSAGDRGLVSRWKIRDENMHLQNTEGKATVLKPLCKLLSLENCANNTSIREPCWYLPTHLTVARNPKERGNDSTFSAGRSTVALQVEVHKWIQSQFESFPAVTSIFVKWTQRERNMAIPYTASTHFPCIFSHSWEKGKNLFHTRN